MGHAMTTTALSDRRARLKLVVSERAESGTVERILRKRLRERRERRGALDRREAQKTKEAAWLDIAGALELDGAGSPANLLEACRLGKVRHCFRHKGRWWWTKPVRHDVLQRATIFENRLIGADGSELENDHWQFQINLSDWREHLGGPVLEVATPGPAEGVASQPHLSQQVEQPDISNKNDIETAPANNTRKRATKRATIETYAEHQRIHLADANTGGKYASREDDEAWAKANGYAGRHVRDVLRQRFYEGLPASEQAKFNKSGKAKERSA
jgi:hypothetical protein